MVTDPPAMQETRGQSLGQEDPLEEGMATHSSILAWRIPWSEEPGGLQSMGSQRIRHDWATNFHVRNSLCLQQAIIDTFISGGCVTYSMKRWAMPCRATQYGRVMVERSDKTWSTGEENGKALQYSCLENPTNSMKKIWHWKMNSPGRQVSHMLLEISGEITPKRMKRWSQSKNNTQLWMWLVMELESNAVKNNIA